MLLGLRTLMLPARSLPELRNWWSAALGLAPSFDQPFYVGFDVMGYELGLDPGDGGPADPSAVATAYFGSDSLDADFARLTGGLGARPLEEPHGVGGDIRVALVRDPFGNRIGLIENPGFRVPALGSVTVSEPPGTIASLEAGLAARRLVRTAHVPAPPDEAWALWTSSEAIARWLLPRSRVELRIGGPFELYFLDEHPPGLQGSEGCRILSFLPGRMLSFTWNAPPHLERTRPLRTFVVVEFQADGGGTRVELTHLGWPERGWDEAGSQWPATFEYFEVAWGRLLQAFERQFAAR